jgi:hypothetical protein
MRFLSPHKMALLGGGVTITGGTLEVSYEATDLVDGDPSFPVKMTGGTLGATITGTSQTVNGVVVVQSNLDAGTAVGFSGGFTAAVVMPPVPPNEIRLNGYVEVAPMTASGCAVSIAGHATPIIVGEILAGEFQELRTLPPDSKLEMVPFEVPYEGEYGGLSQDRFAEARAYGGSIYVTNTMKKLVDDWWRASRNNSLPSVIVPFPDEDDGVWVVVWTQYAPSPVEVTDTSSAAWRLDVEWRELPRYRWQVV